MRTIDRRRCAPDVTEQLRARLPLLQRARLAELEHAGWTLQCIRQEPPQVVIVSPKKRAALLTPTGQLAEPMGVTLRPR